MDGSPMSALPISLVRDSSVVPEVVPAECQFIEDGPVADIKAGAPAAVGLTNSGVVVNLMALESATRAADTVLRLAELTSDPQCASYTTNGKPVTVSPEKTAVSGLDNALRLTMVEDGDTNISITGNVGTVVVVVATPEAQGQHLADLVNQVLAQL
ncbi:hypothetical protein [Aestuariimicrobium sp. Y1814]|uniref:hypothetical protein n=1 Tax=Aestuariimicrobium sp. Y1814 TaxID=3418742 RepID=UPI003DA793D2